MRANIKIRRGTPGRITIAFPYAPSRVAKIKTIEGSRWHPEQKYWSVPYSDGVIEEILSIFSDEKIDIGPSLQVIEKEAKATRGFEDLKWELTLRKYSQKTIKAYIHYNKDFLKVVDKNPKEITDRDIKDYLFHLVDQRKISTSTLNTAINPHFPYQTGNIGRFLW